jgi:hypothetical protein
MPLMSESRQKPTPPINRWDRQPNETKRQFEVFRTYRDQPPLKRSLAKVAQELGFSDAYVERLSANNGWSSRVDAFDADRDRKSQALHWREIEDMRERQAGVAAIALEKARDALSSLDTGAMRAGDIARLLEVAGRLERSARGVADGYPDEPRTVLNADEIRRALREQGLL